MTRAGNNVALALAFLHERKASAQQQSKKRNLDTLWAVLEEMRKEGQADYSLVAVGKRLEKAGGLKTQSLRNASGADFRRLIDLYREAFAPEPASDGGATQLERALALISDAGMRTAIKAALAESKRLKVENDRLHGAMSGLLIPATPPTLALRSDIQEPEIRLPKRLRDALSKGLSEGRLRERGLSVQEDGAIADMRGDLLFPPGFATAIAEVLKLTGDRPSAP